MALPVTGGWIVLCHQAYPQEVIQTQTFGISLPSATGFCSLPGPHRHCSGVLPGPVLPVAFTSTAFLPAPISGSQLCVHCCSALSGLELSQHSGIIWPTFPGLPLAFLFAPCHPTQCSCLPITILDSWPDFAPFPPLTRP